MSKNTRKVNKRRPRTPRPNGRDDSMRPMPPPAERPIKLIVDRLISYQMMAGDTPIHDQQHLNQLSARCPAHNDSSPSLSISEASDGVALLYCHAGCEVEEILRAINLAPINLYPARDKTEYRRKVTLQLIYRPQPSITRPYRRRKSGGGQ